jgi:hypothetical protein
MLATSHHASKRTRNDALNAPVFLLVLTCTTGTEHKIFCARPMILGSSMYPCTPVVPMSTDCQTATTSEAKFISREATLRKREFILAAVVIHRRTKEY